MPFLSCRERISDELHKTMQILEASLGFKHTCKECGISWWDNEDDGHECPQCDGTASSESAPDIYFAEDVLGITKRYVVYCVSLSLGRLADGLYLYVNPEDGAIERAEYYFQDQRDIATIKLSDLHLVAATRMFEQYVKTALIESRKGESK